MEEVKTEFSVESALKELAEKREQWKNIEERYEDLLEQISGLEKEIKEYAKSTGTEAEGGGLKVSFVSGRISYDGSMLFDTCQKVSKELVKMEEEIGIEKIVVPNNILSRLTASVKFLEYALEDGAKQGEKTLKIAAAKGKKA
jgi:hypothetical protein